MEIWQIIAFVLSYAAGYGTCHIVSKRKINANYKNKGVAVQNSNVGGNVVQGNLTYSTPEKKKLYIKISAKTSDFKSSPPAFTIFKNEDGSRKDCFSKKDGEIFFWLVPNTSQNWRIYKENFEENSKYSATESD